MNTPDFILPYFSFKQYRLPDTSTPTPTFTPTDMAFVFRLLEGETLAFLEKVMKVAQEKHEGKVLAVELGEVGAFRLAELAIYPQKILLFGISPSEFGFIGNFRLYQPILLSQTVMFPLETAAAISKDNDRKRLLLAALNYEVPPR